MAIKDLTALRDNAQQKTYSVSAATLGHEDFNGTDKHKLFNLPESSVIVNAFLVVHTIGNTGLSFKVTVGTHNLVRHSDTAHTDIVHETNNAHSVVKLENPAFTGTAAGSGIDTDTGVAVYLTPSVAVTAGSFTLMLKYIEYTVKSGHLTNYK